jgi:glycosyltransferase involved in cell wall biosynthesis
MTALNIKKICVLHEYGANNHYKGLTELCLHSNIEIEFYEFRFMYQFAKAIYRRDFGLLKRSIKNLFFILSLFFSTNRDKHLILGVAPYDWRMVFINHITKNYNVYLHTSWPFWVGAYQPKRKPSKIVESSWREFIYRTNKIFAVTESVKQGILQKYDNLNVEHIQVVYHSIDNDFFTAARNVTNSDAAVSVIYVGRFDDSKGLSYIENLANKTKYKHIKFYFVGNGSYMFKGLANCEVLGNIRSRSELAKILSGSDVLLLPGKKTKYWQELFGMVIIEAMCCGVFPITTNHLGPSEILSGVEGALIDQDDILCDMELKLDCYLSKSYLEKVKIKKMLISYADNYKADVIAQRWEKGFINV